MTITPLFLTFLTLAPQPTTALEVELTFSKAVLNEPFTGRVFVMATKQANEKSPPPGLAWFNPQPCFAQEVEKWQPDSPLKFEPRYSHPKKWEEIAREKVYLQAIV